MRKSAIIFVLVLINSFPSVAQQNNIWYFGLKGGLDFNDIPGSSLPVAIGNSVMMADEGCGSICDINGQLLFYSNGVTVYNRKHEVMLNGDNLAGNTSSVQSCLIVPVPGNDSIYYIFTSDALENNYARGYRYSVVNMHKDNGNGEVIAKNILLQASCTERLTAARHADGVSVWVITNDNSSNTFRTWLINCNGLQPTPVVSNSGVVLDQDIVSNTGMMKISPDGKQLCQTHFPAHEFDPNFAQLFDFDNATGMLSNPRSINFPDAQFLSCEFSPDSKLLYLVRTFDQAIDQVEAKLPTAAAIIASRVTMNTGTAGFLGIQLAPDGKIYLAWQSIYLGAINKPDIKGFGCDYKQAQIQLNNSASYLGLPAFINDLSYDPNNGFIYTILDSCTGTVQFYGNSAMSGTLNWLWDFGDGNTSSLQNPVHTYTPANRSYPVKLEITSQSGCGLINRSKIVFPGGLVATLGFDFESNCDARLVRFTNLSTIFPDTSAVRFVWNFDDGTTSGLTNPVHMFSSPGSYDVRLDMLTSTSCLNKSVTKTLNLELLNITASADREIEAGQTIQLGVAGAGAGSIFTWSPSTWLSDTTIASPFSSPDNNIKYKVVVRNDAGCSDSDYVSIKVLPYPGIYMPTGFTPNNDGLNDLVKPIITKEFTLHQFAIYNRWGQKIFATSEKGAGWNGKLNGILQDSGVYVWIISATDSRNNKKYDLKGTFVIIRK